MENIVKSVDTEFNIEKIEKAEGGYGYSISAVLSTVGGDRDSDGDLFRRGAFDRFIKEFSQNDSALPIFVQHSPNTIVGGWQKLYMRGNNLVGEGFLTETDYAKNYRDLIQQKVIRKISIGFKPLKYVNMVEQEDKEYNARYDFLDVDLKEASIVVNPSNKNADILTIKNEKGEIDIRNLEKMLLDGGLTRTESKLIISKVKTELLNGLRDAEPVDKTPNLRDAGSKVDAVDAVAIFKESLAEKDKEITKQNLLDDFRRYLDV